MMQSWLAGLLTLEARERVGPFGFMLMPDRLPMGLQARLSVPYRRLTDNNLVGRPKKTGQNAHNAVLRVSAVLRTAESFTASKDGLSASERGAVVVRAESFHEIHSLIGYRNGWRQF